MKIFREKLIKWLRLNSTSFFQLTDEYIHVEVKLPKEIELED